MRLAAAAASLLPAAGGPSPSPTVVQAPPPDPLQTVGAVAAIVLTLLAGILAYRVIRGGRGL
jgi:hypothetical protein